MKRLMKKKLVILTIFIITIVSVNLYPQENQPTLFPSLLTVKYNEGYILINFEPLKDKNYNYKIYRSDSAILKEQDLSDKKLVKTIKPTDLPFKDIPPSDGMYYYAVIASKNNQYIKKLVPLQNTLIYPVDFSPYPEPVKITKTILKKDNKIEIYIDPVRKNWKYFLYVSNKKINDLTGLKPEKIIVGPKNYFTINIERGVDYYFAVTVQNRLNVKDEKLLPGQNVTVNPIKIEKVKQTLPAPKTKEKIQPKEKKTRISFTKEVKPRVKPKAVHKYKPNTEALISRTISIYFIKGKYKRTIQELNWILKKYPTNAKQKSEIYFYLGQSYFYLKNIKKSLKYFILCKDYPYYKKEAEAWIDRVLK